jgi:dynein heavy chain
MAIQQDIRTKESEIDAILGPIEHVYALLQRYEVTVPAVETEEVAGLKQTWVKMNALSVSVGENLQRLQAGFKRELLKQVRLFVADAAEFRSDWDANGPMVPGVKPLEAIERLDQYKALFEVRKRKWNAYVDGEELFGLTVTQYP